MQNRILAGLLKWKARRPKGYCTHNAHGATLLRARDGAFDDFLLPHSDAVVRLVLKLEGSKPVGNSARNFRNGTTSRSRSHAPG
jgi:hypothetical protein